MMSGFRGRSTRIAKIPRLTWGGGAPISNSKKHWTRRPLFSSSVAPSRASHERRLSCCSESVRTPG